MEVPTISVNRQSMPLKSQWKRLSYEVLAMSVYGQRMSSNRTEKKFNDDVATICVDSKSMSST